MRATQNHWNKILAVAAATLLSLAAGAQGQPDSLRVEDNPLLRDARSYSMQRRYRTRDKVPFESKGFFDNSFVGFSAGRNNTFREEFADGAEASILFGKWFNAYHGIRLNLGASSGKDNYDGTEIGLHGFDLAYLFDFTHYLMGYDPYRAWDVTAAIGAGLDYQKYKAESALSWSAHLGFDFTFRAFKNLSFFVEPALSVASDPGLYKHDVNWRQYVTSLDATAGLVYNIRSTKPKVSNDFERLYFFASVGALIHNNLLGREANILPNLGASASLGLGFGCLDWLGFRASLALSNCLWDNDSSQGLRATTYAGLRLEAEFDLLPKFNHASSSAGFGLAILLGPETGYMRKTDGDLLINSWYTGATGALHFDFRVGTYCSIYLEPRATIIPYSAPTDKPAPQKYWERNYYDGLFSLSVGVKYRLSR